MLKIFENNRFAGIFICFCFKFGAIMFYGKLVKLAKMPFRFDWLAANFANILKHGPILRYSAGLARFQFGCLTFSVRRCMVITTARHGNWGWRTRCGGSSVVELLPSKQSISVRFRFAARFLVLTIWQYWFNVVLC